MCFLGGPARKMDFEHKVGIEKTDIPDLSSSRMVKVLALAVANMGLVSSPACRRSNLLAGDHPALVSCLKQSCGARTGTCIAPC